MDKNILCRNGHNLTEKCWSDIPSTIILWKDYVGTSLFLKTIYHCFTFIMRILHKQFMDYWLCSELIKSLCRNGHSFNGKYCFELNVHFPGWWILLQQLWFQACLKPSWSTWKPVSMLFKSNILCFPITSGICIMTNGT